MTDDQLTPTGTVTPEEEPQATVIEAPAEPAPAMEAAETPAETPASPEAEAVTTPEPVAPVAEAATAEASVMEAPQAEAPMAEAPVSEPMAAAAPAETRSDAELFEAALASMESDEPGRENHSGINRGDRIEAKVIQVEKDRVFVDLGTKAEGVVPLSELTEENVDSAVGIVKPGDTFEVIVVKTAGSEGNPIVSKRKADFDLTWKKILDAFEEGKVYQAQVIDRVKGGLVVDIGVRGFVPATHVGTGKLRNIEKYVGGTLPVKIIEIDRERRKVVLSNRSAESERREEVKANLFNTVQTGDILPGTVRRLTDYGAFVDLGGIDGLLHISEMSWARIDHPREVLKEGDEINVLVLRLDSANGRVSLGLRQVLPDPWNLVKENYKLGERIKVKVGRMVQSGVFVKLPEGAEAFLPLSECSDKRLKRPQDELEEGQDIEPMIIDLRTEDRRMVLSLRENARPGMASGVDFGFRGDRGPGGRGGDRGGDRNKRGPRKPGGRDGGDFETSVPQGRTPTGGATIGERLGMLKGFLRSEGDDATEAKPAETPATEGGE